MKNKKQLFLSLCCALMLSTLPVGAASCDKIEDIFGGNKEEENFDQYAGGEFYCGGSDEMASGANTLSLTDSETVTLVINGETLTGTYKFKGDVFTMTFGEKTATATLTEEGVNLTYEGVEYAFIPKVNYTVTYKVGEETKTQTVVNGRPLSKPADPEVDGFMFMGWYADSSFKTPFAFDKAITADTTVYAKFIELDEEAQAFTVKFMVDGVEAFNAVKTEAGIVLNLPTPEKEGATFAGWWVSDTENAEKLTYKYEHQILKQNTTLFAVWENEAPLVSVDENGVTWTAKGVNNSYFVDIKNAAGEELDSGMTTMASYAFDFSAQPAGEYVITVTSTNNQKTTVYYMNKALARVCNFVIEGSTLKFNAVENATKYLITSECGTASHVHNKVDNGNSTVYDFSACHMRAEGITFIVEAVADGFVTSVSDVVTFEQTLPAPEVTADTATDFIKWNAVENATSYDVEINGVVVKENTTATSFDVRNYGVGALNVKVTAKAHGWNSKSSEIVYNKTSLAIPANIKLATTTLTWDAVEGADSYRISIDGQEVVASSNSFDLSSITFADGATSCSVKVKAISFDDDATHSVYSDTVVVQLGEMADTLRYANGAVAWDAVVNVKGYEVQVNDEEIVEVTADQMSYAIKFTSAGQNVIKVRCIKADNSESAWVDLYVTSYKTEFNVDGGEAVDTVYAAAGDEVDLSAVSAKAGYTFDGWFDANGLELAKTVVQGEADVVVNAHWTANKYTIKLVAEQGKLDQKEFEVTFDQPMPQLPVITEGGPDGLTFAGWFDDANGLGNQYADEKGNGLRIWRDTKDVTLIAAWATALQYEEVTDETTGEKAYQVVKGADIKQLSEIRIPAMYKGLPVIGIGGSAFEGCSNLTKLEIPDTIQYIDMGNEGGTYGAGSALKYCYNLREFVVYETDGNHDRVFETMDGLLVQNGIYGKELVYISATWTGEFVVPEGIESIPVNCFYASRFSKITLPSTLKTIAPYAFDEADATEIVFANADQAPTADNALTIGEFAFQACYNITEITLPARLAEVTETTFADIFNRSSKLEKINVATPAEGEAVYSSINGMICNKAGNELLFCSKYRTGDVVIPTSVTSIAKNAFNGCSLIESVTVHAFVTSIGDSAFDGCNGITKLTFQAVGNESAIAIGKRAFYNVKITSLELPKNLGSLGSYAFGSASSLTTVVADIPAEAEVAAAAFGTDATTPAYYVTTLTIGKNAPKMSIAGVFGDKLTTLNVEENVNYIYDKEEGDAIGILYNRVVGEDGEAYPTEVLFCPNSISGDYVLPETITVIADNVFKGKLFTSVTISDKVTSIGANAFNGCTSLKTVTFVNADAALTESNGLTIGDGAFSGCKVLANVVLPNRLTSIGKEAFKGCVKIAGAYVIPENVKTIGDSAFNGCTGITSIALPKNLEKLGTSSSASKGMLVFDGCTKLAAITLDESNTVFKVIDGVLYKLADGVPTELVYCPPLCTGKLVDGKNVIQVPSTVTSVWTSAFKNVSKIATVEFLVPENGPVNLTINKNAFTGASIASVILPEGMTKIADSTFESAGIKSITIPGSVTKIGIKAFKSCTKLETVIFAPGTENLELGATSGNGPFYGCTKLKTIELPERTTLIGYQTFYNCSSLTKITIPSQIETIWGQTFYGATKLASVTFNTTNLKTIKAAGFRKAALTTIDIPDTVETIESSVFADTQIKSFEVPASLKVLDQIFGSGNKVIETITYAEGCQLEAFAKNAFLNCTALKSITIPATVKTIGQGNFNVFSGCTSLTSVKFETNADGKVALEEICRGSFANTKITEFILPESTASKITLGTGLFSGCAGLERVSLASQVVSLSGVFDGCPVSDITLGKNNPYLILENGIVYNAARTEMHLILKDIATETLIIPSDVQTIGEGAFANQPSIKTVILPAGIKVIGASAFENCYNLERVIFQSSSTVADQLEIIDSYTFYGCLSLTSINIPDTVTSIGTYAFAGCPLSADFAIPGTIESFGEAAFMSSGIRSAVIPVGVESLPKNLFADCTLLASVTFAEGSELTTIGNSTFLGCTALKNFVMPDTVTKIDYYAFSESGIETITMSKKLTTLNGNAFQNCTALKSIEIFDGIVKLDYYTFDGCTSLSEVKLPSTLKTMNYYVFQNCTSLEEIVLPENLKTLDEGGSSWKTSRKSFAFAGCTSLKKVDLGGVTKIGHNAFAGCTALVDIDLSKVTDMNDKVFLGCSSLTSVDLSSLKVGGYNVFDGCNNLEEVTFGSQLTTIGNYMFANCTKVANFDLPATVTKIGNGAFQNCRSVVSMMIPAQVTTINANTFDGCSSLEFVGFKGAVNKIYDYAFRGCEKITEFTIPSTINGVLGRGIFAGTSLTSITLPKSYIYTSTSATAGSFVSGCHTLQEILVEKGNEVYKSVDGVLYTTDGVISAVPGGKKFENDTFIVNDGEEVGSRVFSFLNNVKKVVLPDSMTVLGQNAFRDCYGLEEVVLGANLGEIKSWAFQDCPNLKKVAKADGTWEGITKLNSNAFMGCALESVVLPSTLTTVSSGIFSDSMTANDEGIIFESGLKQVTIPSTLTAFSTMFQKASNLEKVIISEGITAIPQSAFTNCPNLKEVVLPSTLTTINKNAFDGCTALTSIVIPNSVTTIGASAFANCTALTSVTLPAGLTVLDSSVFSGCSALASIKVMEAVEGSDELVAVEKLPDALTTINASAFSGTALTSVVIPDSVTTINASAFKDCKALTSVVLPSGLTAINGSVFAGCSALTSIVLPETVTSIGANAFDGCSALASINIPEAVTSIGTSAFAGCTSITSIVIPATTAVGQTAFSGWTEAQTINAFVGEYEAAKIWTFGWNVGSAANRVFNYTPAN